MICNSSAAGAYRKLRTTRGALSIDVTATGCANGDLPWLSLDMTAIGHRRRSRSRLYPGCSSNGVAVDRFGLHTNQCNYRWESACLLLPRWEGFVIEGTATVSIGPGSAACRLCRELWKIT